uniref:BRCT domain-containing protein n=1 Tax=Lygus hesperus TaxID=30085 RepID=A0A146LZG8_LYGHE
MDLTDPAIPERTSSSTDAATPADTQESQPFPKIRLSLRPECLVTNVSEPQEDEFEAIPGWWNVPKWEQLMAFPEELPIEARPLSVPSHYKEDKKSRFLTLLWISRTLYAHDNGNPPPKGITRVFHDPRMEPELPREIYNLLDKFSDNDIVQILKRFDEVKHLARKFAGGECREHVPGDEEAHSTTGADIPPSCAPNIPSTQYEIEDDLYRGYHFYTETDEAAHVQEPTTGDAVSDSKITLVYAKFQKWYYPGIMECTVEEWDTSTRPITVQFYDGSPDQHLQPDMIFPLQRLPPGANIQLQLESNIYEDVFFMSFERSVHESSKPSANVTIFSEDSPVTSTTFPLTALSPKDVVQIRSALKNAFYPSRSRINFTELTTGSILEYASRRTRVAAGGDHKKKPQQVPVKRKKDVTQKPSSSTESAPSTPKRTKTEVTSTPLAQPSTAPLPPEPSSTEQSYTSPEGSPNVAYLCTAPGCGKLFETERLLLDHREKIKRNRKRQHTTMKVVSRDALEQNNGSARKLSDKKVNSAGPSRPGGSRCVTIQLPQSSRPSDSETDTNSLCTDRWSRCVSGYGLRPEKCTLSDRVKSFKKLKGGSRGKYHPPTGLFTSQHFILTDGPPQTFSKRRKRAIDSESESTDVENYYATSVEFDVLKLQEAIECGGGRIYSDFSDVPNDLRKNPGHNLIVVSGHPTCTVNYIYGVSLGCTIVRHDTILDCASKKIPLRDALSSGSAILLPPGWCEQKMTWAPPRASPVKPLKDLMFFLALRCNQESKSFWSSLILHLGGKPIVIEGNHQLFARLDRSIYGIVADPDVATSLFSQALEKGVPIVNTAWVVQAVITGSQPPFAPYAVSVVDSSS